MLNNTNDYTNDYTNNYTNNFNRVQISILF